MTTVTLASTPETAQTQAVADTQTGTPVVYLNEEPISDSGLTIVGGVTYMPLSVFFPAMLPG